MKTFVKLTVLLVALLSGTAVYAEGKIAILNVQQAIINTERAQARLQELREEPGFSANLKEAQELTKSFQQLREQLQKDAAVMSAEQQQEEASKLQEKRADIEHVQRKIKSAEQKVLQELVNDMGPDLEKVVDELIKAEGIGLLLNRQAAMYVDSSYSITAKVTDKLNQMQ